MPYIRLEGIVLTGIVTLGSGVQLMYFARKVWQARERHGIQFPAMTGNPDFERVVRAQQNTLEWYPVYMSALWTSSIFFHQVPAAICGVIYMYSRHKYFQGYSRSVEERLPGVFMGARVLMGMTVMAAIGLIGTLLNMHSSHKFGCSFTPRMRLPRFHFRFHH